jgi:hypothetical protein
VPTPTDDDKGTDDVSGAARPVPTDGDAADAADLVDDPADAADLQDPLLDAYQPGPDAAAPPPAQVEELARACVRFVTARFGATLDYQPETLSFVDQWLREARVEVLAKPEAIDLAQAAAGGYFGEVVRRWFGARWVAEGEHATWKLCLSNVYCAFNPIGMAREALLMGPAEGWHGHLELDPADRPGIEARLGALPAADDDEYYAPTTRFDVLCIVVDALRTSMRARGRADARFAPDDYK